MTLLRHALCALFLVVGACEPAGQTGNKPSGTEDPTDACQSGADEDGDGVSDACDPCPADDPDDTDGDGVCDSADVCAGFDDGVDGDGDGQPDACDPCPVDDPDDTDGDGVCDAQDLCPLDLLDDSDGDGSCDSDDLCPGTDDNADTDGNQIPDGCACSDALLFERAVLDSVDVPHASDFSLGSGDFTVEIQGRFGGACSVDDGLGICTAVSHSDGVGPGNKWSLGWAFDAWAGGGLVFLTEEDTGAANAFFFYGDPGLLNAWHAYAVVRTGDVLDLYVDGVLVMSEPILGSMPDPVAPLVFGLSEGSNALDGGLRQIRLSDVARYAGAYVPQEILVSDADTLGLWAMDEGSGAVAADGGPGAHDGAVHGAQWGLACKVDAGGGPVRTVLTYDDLVSGPEQPVPVDDTAGFGMPVGVSLPDHVFEGRLELRDEDLVGQFVKVKDDYNYDSDDERLRLPEFDHTFVQSGHDLIPVARGQLNTDHPYWTMILEPGKVWKEAGDNGLSRASLPFAILQRNANCTHNGLLTFLYDDTSVSKVHYQITQETCAYFQGDFWGLLDATYHPEEVGDAAQIQSDFAVEQSLKVPTRPIGQLAVDFPGTDLSTLTSGITPINTTQYGFVYGGISYVSACVTRSGTYPFCDVMRMPSYSLSKSVFAGTVRMAMEEKYGVDVGAEIVDTWVVEAAAGRGDFTDVTIDHALDMTTGHYKFSTYMVDEAGLVMTSDFFLAETLAEKSAGAFDWMRKADPGNNWVYRSSDTFIATRAMSEYLQTLAGPGTDIFDFLVDEVWRPLDIGPGAHTSLRTSDNNWQGETFGGYGLWLIADDLAKLTRLLNVDGGQIDAVQVLNPASLDAAMQRDPSDRGMLTTAGVPFHYNNGFWALEFTQAQGYPCDFWVPFMSGYGGITVAMMPSGATFWVVSDNDEYDWQDVVDEAQRTVADNCAP